MYVGQTLFAQIMDFLPWSTFHRIVERYAGNYRVRTLNCAEQFRAMAFAQLTYRKSLRDIETCLSAQAVKLYHMGFHQPIRRSTLADANEARDWRIYAEFAQRPIRQARRWAIELFFKWIKQHLRIERFYGTSENAVKSQIWIAVSVYVLVAIIKKRLSLQVSLYSLLQILSLTLFEKMPIQQAFAHIDYNSDNSVPDKQLNLFIF
jgi:hypothetical protein